MATPHIAANNGDFAPDVLMPGDPRRAKLIALKFFENPRLVTQVRGILGYTGTYNNKPVSVIASGMGVPSISIYATELAREFGVKRIIRVGTIGAMAPHLKIGDVVAASSADTDSGVMSKWVPGVSLSHAPDFTLMRRAVEYGESNGKTIHVGPVFTGDSFYNSDENVVPALMKLGTLGTDMEAAGLYAIARREGFAALMLATVSDLPGEEMTAEQRETTFIDMVSFGLAAFQ